MLDWRATHNSKKLVGAHSDSGSDRPWVRMSVYGMQTPALIDTGAVRSLMSSLFYDKLISLSKCPKRKPTSVRLHSYTGHPIVVLGEVKLPIHKNKHIKVVVVKGVEDTPLLIGADALQRAGSSLDFTSRTVTILGKSYDMIPRADTPDAVSSVSDIPTLDNDVFRRLVEKHKDVFGGPGTLGECTLPAVSIETGDARPIKQKSYRLPLVKRTVVESEVTKMLEMGIIRPSMSPWASPITLAPKKGWYR